MLCSIYACACSRCWSDLGGHPARRCGFLHDLSRTSPQQARLSATLQGFHANASACYCSWPTGPLASGPLKLQKRNLCPETPQVRFPLRRCENIPKANGVMFMHALLNWAVQAIVSTVILTKKTLHRRKACAVSRLARRSTMHPNAAHCGAEHIQVENR